MTRRHRADRGLGAAVRVREVRERDSRLGLLQVLAEEGAAHERMAALLAHLGAARVPDSATPAEQLAVRTALLQVGLQVQTARAAVETAAAVTAEARIRWNTDRSRLAAVEHLLEARAARRRTEVARRAALEDDDLAARAWLRGREAPA